MSVPSAIANLAENTPRQYQSDTTELSFELKRIGPLKDSKRALVWSVCGREQVAEVKDTSGTFVFEGSVADANDPKQVGSPMPGMVEKMLVKEGQSVAAGDVLFAISAMKMEVKVTAPAICVVEGVAVTLGTRVIEGALLCTLKL